MDITAGAAGAHPELVCAPSGRLPPLRVGFIRNHCLRGCRQHENSRT